MAANKRKRLADRPQRAFTAMCDAMHRRYVENDWRNRTPFPTEEEIIVSALKNFTRAICEWRGGVQKTAMDHLADAANLLALAMVVDTER